jgi:hypothetical protein
LPVSSFNSRKAASSGFSSPSTSPAAMSCQSPILYTSQKKQINTCRKFQAERAEWRTILNNEYDARRPRLPTNNSYNLNSYKMLNISCGQKGFCVYHRLILFLSCGRQIPRSAGLFIVDFEENSPNTKTVYCIATLSWNAYPFFLEMISPVNVREAQPVAFVNNFALYFLHRGPSAVRQASQVCDCA